MSLSPHIDNQKSDILGISHTQELEPTLTQKNFIRLILLKITKSLLELALKLS